MAKEQTGLDIIKSTFEDLKIDKKFDGIYARNSLLHVKKEAFEDVVNKLTEHLNKNGILWATLKAGNEEKRDNKADCTIIIH